MVTTPIQRRSDIGGDEWKTTVTPRCSIHRIIFASISRSSSSGSGRAAICWSICRSDTDVSLGPSDESELATLTEAFGSARRSLERLAYPGAGWDRPGDQDD